jgi:hypothetical protein
VGSLTVVKREDTQQPKRRNKIRVVHARRGTPDPISTLSLEEQARMLTLADVALHNPNSDEGTRPRAGERAHLDHERLMSDLHAAVRRFEGQRKRIG